MPPDTWVLAQLCTWMARAGAHGGTELPHVATSNPGPGMKPQGRDTDRHTRVQVHSTQTHGPGFCSPHP